MLRKLQATANVVIALPLIKKDGTQAIGLVLTTLATKIIKPDGTALTGYTEATFTEPNGDGIYVCIFPSAAATKAFTLVDQPNPYVLTLDSSTADVEPTAREIEIVSVYPWEWAKQSTLLALPADITAAIVGSQLAQNVLLSRVSITGDELELQEANVKTFLYDFGSSWNLTGKVLFFTVKENKTDALAAAIINTDISAGYTNAAEGEGSHSITVPATGNYSYEYTRYDADGTSNRETVMIGILKSRDVVRK